MATLILVVLFLALIPIFHLLTRGTRESSKKLPPGSMGFPIVGHSLAFLRARRANRAEEWLERRVNKYGPISKLSLFGKPTVFVTGPAANKFIFNNEALTNKQPPPFSRLSGKTNMFELMGEDHKRVRGAIAQFLKPEVLKQYVMKIDGEVRDHLKTNWTGRRYVTVMPLMLGLSFDMICSLIFGIHHGSLRESLMKDFMDMLKGFYSVSVDLPFTNYNKALKASRRARKVITRIVREKKAALQNGSDSTVYDGLITYLLSLNDEMTEEEIIDNATLLIAAGYDNPAILTTFIVRRLANDPVTNAAVVHEQEEIARNKAPGEPLTWDDLIKMKYTWRVAMETLRMIPPVFGTFRTVIKDVEFDGYLIPKGWQDQLCKMGEDELEKSRTPMEEEFDSSPLPLPLPPLSNSWPHNRPQDFDSSLFPLPPSYHSWSHSRPMRSDGGNMSLDGCGTNCGKMEKGELVYWAACSTQMDANIFPDPWKFDPMRFENQSSIPPYCFVAFGGGYRICPGNEFAKIQVLVVMHYLVTRFKWKLCCKNDAYCRYPTPSPSEGLPIQLEHLM